MIRCPSCSTENPDGARFCNQCGSRMAAPEAAPQDATPRPSYTPKHLVERVLKDRAALMGERKLVTVLFADIKGSTRLAQQAGAEGWHAILDRFFSILSAAVHRYEGTVNQYTGDGIMALFGAPVAHEDHASRACLAALDCQAEVRRFADELRLERGLNLSMRVGLNTGEVIVGRIGDDLRMDYTAQGLTVNLAARLEHICEPGRVLASRNTAGLVEGYFDVRSLGETLVAGHDEPIEVFELQGRGRHGSRLERQLARGHSSYIGRGREIARLHVALATTIAGTGQVVGVIGGAGIGKSRLCHEFLSAVTAQGIPVHRAYGLPYARNQTMLAAVHLARSRLGFDAHTPADQVRRILEEKIPTGAETKPGVRAFVHEFFGVGEPGALTPDLALMLREPMQRHLIHLLTTTSRPQVLVVEDLHFFDDFTLHFLVELAKAIKGSPTLLILTWRDDAEPSPVPGMDEQLGLAPLKALVLEQIALEGLGPDPSVAPLAVKIAERASGNPFFVEEAITALAETGQIGGERGHYRLLREIGRLPIPDTVHALIAARIDRLPSEQKFVLQGASVIGSEFDPCLLADMGETGAEDALAALEDAGFLRAETRGGEKLYVFSQPLLREIAYGAQLETHRARMHARLAARLERGGAAAGRSIAHHWAAAGEWVKAGRWNLQAATWLSVRDARACAEQYQFAITHLDKAPDGPEVQRLRIAARAGLIRIAQFWHFPEDLTCRAYEEAHQLADALGDPTVAAELTISFANEQLHRGRAERSVSLVRDAFRLAPEAARPALANRFRLVILMTHNAVGRIQDGVALSNEMGGDHWHTGPIEVDNHLSRGFLVLRLLWIGELKRAAADLAAAIAVAEREGRTSSWMHAFRVDSAWFSGDPTGVLDAARRSMEQAEAFGSLFFRAVAFRAYGEALCLLGRHEEALAPLLESRPLAAKGSGAFQFEANHLAVLCEAGVGAGRFDDAAQWGQAAIESAQRSGSRLWELRAWTSRLALPASVLSDDEARAGFDRAWSLVDLTQGEGLRPKLEELAARREPDAERRRAMLLRARDGYARIGADHHAHRLAGLLGI